MRTPVTNSGSPGRSPLHGCEPAAHVWPPGHTMQGTWEPCNKMEEMIPGMQMRVLVKEA